jgi:hypothetical protein
MSFQTYPAVVTRGAPQALGSFGVRRVAHRFIEKAGQVLHHYPDHLVCHPVAL